MKKRMVPIIAAVLAVVLAFAPGWSDPDWSSYEPSPPPDGEEGWISFPGGHDGSARLWGKLTLPATTIDGRSHDELPPVIILAPGGGLSQFHRMSPFVDEFVKNGYATFTFDFSTFGMSENGNYPRHTFDPYLQVAELKGAASTLRSQSKELGVDGDNIALWGVSCSGAHILVAASENENEELPGVKAVLAVVPLLTGGFTALYDTLMLDPHPFTTQMKIFALILKGAMMSLAGRPWYLPFYALDGSVALQQGTKNNEGYASLLPPENDWKDWRNGMEYSSLFKVFKYQPSNDLKRIKLPVSLIVANNDTLCKVKYAMTASEEIKDSELVVLPDIDHFDVWFGDTLDKVLDTQLQFLQKHLLGNQAMGQPRTGTTSSM